MIILVRRSGGEVYTYYRSEKGAKYYWRKRRTEKNNVGLHHHGQPRFRIPMVFSVGTNIVTAIPAPRFLVKCDYGIILFATVFPREPLIIV